MRGLRRTLSVLPILPSLFIKLRRFPFPLEGGAALSTDKCFECELEDAWLSEPPSVRKTEGAVLPLFDNLRGCISAAPIVSGERCPSVGVTGAEAGLWWARSSELPEKSRRMLAAGLLSVRLRGGMVEDGWACGSDPARWTADVDWERGEGLGRRPPA